MTIYKTSKIYVTGATGMVGSAVVRALVRHGYKNIKTDRVDLTEGIEVHAHFDYMRPDFVIHCAGVVGGIGRNTKNHAEMCIENVGMAVNVVKACAQLNCGLLYLGSTCAYPLIRDRDIKESDLLTGPFEQSNEGYALAKALGVKLCEHFRNELGYPFIAAMPCNLYGPNDNYSPQNSHVIPALIRKFHDAKQSGLKSVELWGTGEPIREFLHVDDLAEAVVEMMEKHRGQTLNLGTGRGYPVSQLANMIAKTVGYTGAITWNCEHNGAMRKVSDQTQSRAALKWRPTITLEAGLHDTYMDFLARLENQTLRI